MNHKYVFLHSSVGTPLHRRIGFFHPYLPTDLAGSMVARKHTHCESDTLDGQPGQTSH